MKIGGYATNKSLIKDNEYRIQQRLKAIKIEENCLKHGDKHRSAGRIKANIQRLNDEIKQLESENQMLKS